MPGLKDEDIYAVRTSVTMLQVARYYNLDIRKGGMACCPLHKGDNSPSLKIYPGSRGYYCFGCHAGGDVIDFVMRHDGIEFQDAVKRLAGIFGIALPGGDELPEDVKSKIAEMKRERDDVTRLRNLADKRLKELSGAINRMNYWKSLCEPMDALWCGLVKRIEKAEMEWEFLFNEQTGSRVENSSQDKRKGDTQPDGK